MKWLRENWWLFLIASLTLGLAPFMPEPHLFGKLRWVAGGGEGMAVMDWFDLLMHGAPWLFLIVSAVLNVKPKLCSRRSD